MALKSVVTEVFFEEVMQALKFLEEQNGVLAFALLSSAASDPARWSLTLAAPWIDAMSPLRAAAKVRGYLDHAVEERSKIGAVLIRSTLDPIVRSFLSTLDIPSLGTAYSITGLELDYFNMAEAVCLLARPTVAHTHALSA